MFIDKNLDHYLVKDEFSILDVLRKINHEKGRIMMVVDSEMHLLGVITNGDIIRHLLSNKQPNLSIPVSEVCNKEFTFVTDQTPNQETELLLKDFNFIPVIDTKNKLIAIARRGPDSTLKIGNVPIGFDTQTFIIAEIGINHCGSIEKAKKLVLAAADCGADAVKVQVRNLEEFYNSRIIEDSLKAEHGTQYLLHELKKSNLENNLLFEIKKLAEENGLVFFGTPFDLNSADFLNTLNVPVFKIGSPDFTNITLIEKISEFGKPIIISTGMSTEFEIERVIQKLNSMNIDYALLHCNSTYPASIEDLNLKYLLKLKKLSGRLVGYSGHERGYLPTLAAVSLGAKIIERHLTLDSNYDGPDHSSSLEPADFKEMVDSIRSIEIALGKGKRIFNQGEQVNRIALGKSLVVARDLEKGAVLEQSDLLAKTPARGVSPLEIDKFLGKEVCRNLKKDDYIQVEDISESSIDRKDFDISKHWGIVGRMNDFEDFLHWKPKLVEIHLTWRDLIQFEPHSVAGRYPYFEQDLVVHAPEYYRDQLIDFSTNDGKVLEYSLEMLSRTIDLTRSMSVKFRGIKGDRGAKIVLHPGGHFEARRETNRNDQYKALFENLKSIDSDGVEILIENMPPNPWYFGGQWYNTIFMDSAEIKQFADETKFGICYDTSHALLHCNFCNKSLNHFTKDISKYVRHLHVSDAAGTTQEGLQLGTGEIDFEHLFEIFHNVDSGFIPEIWQGHLNRGRGFKDALVKIEELLKDKMSSPGCSHVKALKA